MNNVLTDTIEKQYWKIGEIAAELDIKPSKIRFWESEFGIVVKRTRSGNRMYNQKEHQLIHRIHHLLTVEMYTIPGARKRIAEDMKVFMDVSQFPEA